MGASFKNQFLSGVIWTSIQTFVNRGFKFAVKLILARLLFPEDYGIIGMAAVFTSVIDVINEMGIGAALVQRDKKELTRNHLDTAFWSGAVWGIVIYLIILFLVAPLASWFYEKPILEKIIPILSLGILATPINTVHRSLLVRDLRFKKITFISNTSNIFSGILSIILAFMGAGVWSLVFNSVASFIVAMPLLFISTKWLPHFSFSKSAFKDIFGFGMYTTGTGVFGKINSQIDYLIIGKVLGATALGVYSLAFLLTNILRSQLIQIVNSVLFPLLSKLQNNPDLMRGYYLKILRINSFLVYPFIFAVFLFSEEFIPILFGNKWIGSIPILKILSVGVIINMLVSSSGVLIRSSGKANLELRIISVNTILFYLPFILIGAYSNDLIGTATGYVLAVLFSTIHVMFMLNKHFHLSAAANFRAIRIPLVISLIPFLSVWFLQYYLDVQWFITIPLYSILLCCFAYWLGGDIFVELKSTLLNKRKISFK